MKTTAYTLTIPEMIKNIRESRKESFRNLGEQAANGNRLALMSLESYLELNRASLPEISDVWCNDCSEKFFADNPEITDVLCITSTSTTETGETFDEKYWVVSR